MEQNKITVLADIAADVNKVWEYWTKPEHITGWNFATDDWQCPRAENDLQVGGRYKARMEAKDGSFGFDFEAIYGEVIDKRKLRYTMDDGRQAITDFDDKNGRTTVTTTFDADQTHDPEMQRAGWQAILDNFKRYVESR